MKNKFVFHFLITVILSLTLSGCFPITDAPGADAKENAFVKGAAVKEFPTVPFYPEAEIIESYASGKNYGLSAVSKDDIEKVLEFYKNSFAQLKWENTLIRQTSDNYLFEFRNDKNKGSVTVNVSSDNDRTAITIVVSPR